jgi:hypothetical protein
MGCAYSSVETELNDNYGYQKEDSFINPSKHQENGIDSMRIIDSKGNIYKWKKTHDGYYQCVLDKKHKFLPPILE